jgi:glycosyltransferase involved in cell wall biosynthesis
MDIVSVAYPLAAVTRGTAGGAEQVLLSIDEALVAAGHRSIVVAQEGSDVRGELVATPRVDGPLHDDAKRIARARHRQALDALLASRRVDAVHFHGIDFAGYLPDARVPKIVTLHLPPEWYPHAIWSRDDLTLVAVSESERRRAPRADVVIANGVDLAAFHPDGAHDDYALAMGRICPEKNFEAAVDAAKRARAKLVIAGEVFAYEEHERYYRDVLLPRLDGERIFVGPVSLPYKRKLLARARCVVIPSTVEETSSLVAMEALACGTPVIASPAGALPEIVSDGVTGFITNDFFAALARIGAIDRAACRREAEERFDARRMSAEYLRLYAART